MIESIRVQNYKSLRDVTIPLRPLTLLVGPNASGKSNILDCLAFLQRVLSGGLSTALQDRGGFSDVAWGGEAKDVTITVGFDDRVMPGQSEAPASFQIVFGQRGITGESAQIRMAAGLTHTYSRNANSQIIQDKRTHPHRPSSDTSMLALGELRALRDQIAGWTFYDFIHSYMRRRQRVARDTLVNGDGSNVATVLHWIYSEERALFDQIEEEIKAGIPEVEELLSRLTPQGETYIGWKEKGIPGPIPAWNMSEGSVRLVGVLLALRVPTAPNLVAFETPEIHLHPYLMEYLADILKAGSQRTQIIATTHSAHLLNYVSPENVLIVNKENGETRVEPVEDSEHLREALKKLGLGDLWQAGHLGGVP